MSVCVYMLRVCACVSVSGCLCVGPCVCSSAGACVCRPMCVRVWVRLSVGVCARVRLRV